MMMSEGTASLAPVRPRVLVVDDEPNMCRSLAILVADEGRREVDTARSGEEALVKLGDSTDVLLCDLSMPGIDGIEVLRRVRAQKLDVQVIMMTAYSTVQSAVEAMRLGA
ncbi:MAG: Acetoacetate metabolism regulatory protein AtoC, partial [bacterium]|nr:Acetoacetate metabolism regulatory protein AtoC [bacterium]